MPGPRSKHEHLKPRVYEMLSAGLRPSEVARQLPDIPRATIYRWAEGCGAHTPEAAVIEMGSPARVPPAQSASGQLANVRSQPSQPVPDAEYQEAIADADAYLRSADPVAYEELKSAPDFVLIRMRMRDLLLNSNNGVLQIQAGNLLAKLIQMRADLPLHILHEESQSDIRDAMDDVDALTDEELAQQYRQMLA